jgi:hypothetical protein
MAVLGIDVSDFNSQLALNYFGAKGAIEWGTK